MSVDSWLNGAWLEFSLLQFSTEAVLHNTFCNFPPTVFYAFCNFPQREKVGIFFFFFIFLTTRHSCANIFINCSFLVLSLSFEKKKKKVSTLSQIFFFFCWIFYCFLVHKRVLHLNIFYVTVYFTCRLKNDKKGL